MNMNWHLLFMASNSRNFRPIKKKKKKKEKLDHARSANRSIICHHDHKLQSESRKLHHLIRGLVFDWHFGQKVKKNISKIIFCFFQPWSHFP